MNKLNRSKIYDLLYNQADNMFKEQNPCDLMDNTCSESRRGQYSGGNKCMCCESCKYFQDKRGCTTKSLGCKLYLCVPSRDRHPHISGYLRALTDIAVKLDISCNPRISKEEEELE